LYFCPVLRYNSCCTFGADAVQAQSGLYFRASEDILDSTPMTDAPTSGPGRRMLPPKTGRGRRALHAAMWIGALLLMAESMFGERGFTAMIEARKQHHAMQSSLDQLRAENAALRSRARRARAFRPSARPAGVMLAPAR